MQVTASGQPLNKVTFAGKHQEDLKDDKLTLTDYNDHAWTALAFIEMPHLESRSFPVGTPPGVVFSILLKIVYRQA